VLAYDKSKFAAGAAHLSFVAASKNKKYFSKYFLFFPKR